MFNLHKFNRTSLTFDPLKQPDPARLTLDEVHDRGYVFVGSHYVGVTSREQKLYDLGVWGGPNTTLSVVVESQGRVTVGPRINDFKVRPVRGH